MEPGGRKRSSKNITVRGKNPFGRIHTQVVFKAACLRYVQKCGKLSSILENKSRVHISYFL